jgi:hypothetical protein
MTNAHYTNVNGLRMYYEDHGHGRPLVPTRTRYGGYWIRPGPIDGTSGPE